MKPQRLPRLAWLTAFSVLLLAQLACNYVQGLVSGIDGSNNPAACDNKYFPVKDGATWKMKYTTGRTLAETITNVGPHSFQLKSESIPEDGSKSTVTVSSWSCLQAGLVSSDKGRVKGVAFPVNMNPGDVWSQEWQFRDATQRSSSFTTNEKALGIETVTVPAGTFQALKIQEDAYTTFPDPTMKPVHNTFIIWLAPNVGRVKFTTTTFVGDPLSQVFDAELESYNIP